MVVSGEGDWSSQGGGFFSGPDQMIEEIRSKFGAEAAERARRSMALIRNPRALTDDEFTVVMEALALVLRDLEASGETLPDVVPEAHEDRGEEYLCAWIRMPDTRFGQGIYVPLAASPADRTFWLAEQLQSWKEDELADTGRPGPWPACPEHGGGCVLAPDVREDVAVWCCRRSGQAIAAIGELGPRR
jgi:hypothetical protein